MEFPRILFYIFPFVYWPFVFFFSPALQPPLLLPWRIAAMCGAPSTSTTAPQKYLFSVRCKWQIFAYPPLFVKCHWNERQAGRLRGNTRTHYIHTRHFCIKSFYYLASAIVYLIRRHSIPIAMWALADLTSTRWLNQTTAATETTSASVQMLMC